MSPRSSPWSAIALDGPLRHRVHGVGRHEVDDVHGVGEGRVLGAGRSPQRPLHLRPPGRGPPARSDDASRSCVGQPGVGEAGLAAQRLRLRGAELVQPVVDLGVHPADKEGRHRTDLGQVVPGRGRLQARHVGVDDLAVALQREDQRDVDADPFGDAAVIAGSPLGGGDLDEQVGPVHHPPQFERLGDGLGRVVGQPRVDLERHPAAGPVAVVPPGRSTSQAPRMS